MIYLITGVPGSGKTLYALNFVRSLADKESRPVYYSGIRDLTLSWNPLDGEGADTSGAESWYTLPPSSVVVIDECQRVFRPRGQGSAVPRCVSELETHRHKGIDIVLITQHPMLLDTNVRRLVGSHFHVQRTFGMQRATVHEFQGLREQPDKSRSDSIRHDFRYPVEAFAWYKSAEVHTHKRRIPTRVYFLVILPLILAVLGYLLYSKVSGYATGAAVKDRIDSISPVGQGGHGVQSGQGVSSSGRTLSTRDYVDQHQPRVSGLAYTAPIYDRVTAQVVRAPYPAACVRSESGGCRCYTEQATRLDVSEALCSQVVERGYFVAWDVRPVSERQPLQRRRSEAGSDSEPAFLTD